MNMKSSNKKLKEIEKSFETFFSFDNEKDQVEMDAKFLMAQFLSEIQEVVDDRGLKRNELAESIGTSASYLTQLFRGHKLINLITLAKLQKALDIKFDIKLSGKDKYANPLNEENIVEFLDKWFESNRSSGDYFKVVRNFKSPNNSSDNDDYALSTSKYKILAS